MHVLSPLRVLPALLGLLVLAFVPAAWAAETLVLTCHVCTQVVATGKGLPANATVQVTLTDVRTGQELRSPSVQSSVLTSNGSVLVLAAHNTFNAPCKDGKMMPMDHMGMEDQLAFTGAHTPQFLGLGFGLLAAGAALLVAARRRPARA